MSGSYTKNSIGTESTPGPKFDEDAFRALFHNTTFANINMGGSNTPTGYEYERDEAPKLKAFSTALKSNPEVIARQV